jgi:hypothetical protein
MTRHRRLNPNVRFMPPRQNFRKDDKIFHRWPHEQPIQIPRLTDPRRDVSPPNGNSVAKNAFHDIKVNDMANLLPRDVQRQIDAKLAWALSHREHFPVDVNRAPREMLLRVPGLGERAVDRLLETRRQRPVAVADLRRLRVNWYQVRYFVATADHSPRQRVPEGAENRPATPIAPPMSTGLPLFDAATSGSSFTAA